MGACYENVILLTIQVSATTTIELILHLLNSVYLNCSAVQFNPVVRLSIRHHNS